MGELPAAAQEVRPRSEQVVVAQLKVGSVRLRFNLPFDATLTERFLALMLFRNEQL